MKTRAVTLIFASACLLLLFLARPPSPRAALVVFDRVSTPGKPVFFEFVTRGWLFPRGGVLVHLYLDGKPLGRRLTGLDGHGYFRFVPGKTGRFVVRAAADNETGEGVLLVLKPGKQVVVLEVESIFGTGFTERGSFAEFREALKKIRRKFPVLYLSRFMGLDLVKKWLQKNRLPPSVVLDWRGSETFAALDARGIRIRAVVGSAATVAAAARYSSRRFSFEKTPRARRVARWREIPDLLD